MYKPLVGLAVLTLLAGCSSEWDPSRGNRQAEGAQDRDASAISDVAYATRSKQSTATAVRVAGRSGFATLPDRGELLRYDSRRPSVQRGAYTSYPVELSEEHAFAATRDGGTIQIQAPNGAPITLTYERHVEHPDGNWTWIGRDGNGQDAVLTFGERAVFGSIPNGGDAPPLQLTLSGGRSVLVSTDRSKIGDPNRAVTREGKPDFLVPPSTAAALASNQPVASGAAAESISTAAVASSVIDVVLGYTPGFANANGGDSGAATRLAFLVDISNQAYANSQINARLRLVRTVRVNYPDATNSATALEELTGFKNGGGTVPINAAFNELRSARDQFGGDLVSLVRAFRAPENDGCGIAWLIGGDQRVIQTGDAPFGYSVVSDGTDLDEGDNKTYVCRVETLAHELGHNMGQAHNTEDSSNAGTHPYSYGYREAATSGFYTVMAYRLLNSNQTGIRYFANPSVSVSGRPTGVANASDNARSMNQTMPVISTFRSTVVPVAKGPSDVDGDSRSDVLWLNPAAGRTGYWLMSGGTLRSSREFAVALGYSVAASGDFNGDGLLDLVWTSNAQDLWLWPGTSNGSFGSQFLGSYSGGWQVVAAGDVNADGRSDLIWHNAAAGRMGYWLMNGGSVTQTREFAVASGYSVVASGDFNGDGRTDLLWTSAVRDLWVWPNVLNGNADGRSLISYSTGWAVVGSGDVNGDGKSDILWHNPNATRMGYWLMDGTLIVSSAEFPVASGYRIAASGDFDANGRADLIWTSNAGDLWLWPSLLSGDAGSIRLLSYGGGWQPIRNPLQP